MKLRQATDAEKKFQFQMPSARRQVISLELQNAELVKLLRARGLVPGDGAQMRREFQEASQMRPGKLSQGMVFSVKGLPLNLMHGFSILKK